MQNARRQRQGGERSAAGAWSFTGRSAKFSAFEIGRPHELSQCRCPTASIRSAICLPMLRAACCSAIAAAASIATGRPSALGAGSRAGGFVAASTSRDGIETFGARGYTELFFLDEPTALAAGHRPCFECRRADARAFAAAFARGPAMSADEIDRVLHAQRLDGRAKRGHRRALDGLPDGSVVTLADEPGSAWVVRGPALLQWASGGYAAAHARPRNLMVNVLTTPGTLAALASGYRPRWHPSADARSL